MPPNGNFSIDISFGNIFSNVICLASICVDGIGLIALALVAFAMLASFLMVFY
jgi:hypothetical protein